MSGRYIKKLVALFFYEKDIDDPIEEVDHIYSIDNENPLSNKSSGFFVFGDRNQNEIEGGCL